MFGNYIDDYQPRTISAINSYIPNNYMLIQIILLASGLHYAQ